MLDSLLGFFLSFKFGNINIIIIFRLVLLSGQISDGIATPLVGYLSDKTNTRIGKRMPW